jgi:ribosomal protein S18 acetylase RimI-like enzyme
LYQTKNPALNPLFIASLPVIDIRPAVASDAAQLSELNAALQSFHAALLPNVFKPASAITFTIETIAAELQRNDSVWFVAAEGDTLRGYAFGQIQEMPESPFRMAFRRLVVHHMAVDTGVQRQGVGRRLLDAMKQVARAHDIHVLALDVWGANSEAQSFYLREGFRIERAYLTLEIDGNVSEG